MDVLSAHAGKRFLGNASCSLVYSQAVPANLRRHAREITALHVPEEKRGQGEGSALLQSVCDEADGKGWCLVLMADTRRLARWYQKFGFVLLQQQPLLMARPAKGL